MFTGMLCVNSETTPPVGGTGINSRLTVKQRELRVYKPRLINYVAAQCVIVCLVHNYTKETLHHFIYLFNGQWPVTEWPLAIKCTL